MLRTFRYCRKINGIEDNHYYRQRVQQRIRSGFRLALPKTKNSPQPQTPQRQLCLF